MIRTAESDSFRSEVFSTTLKNAKTTPAHLWANSQEDVTARAICGLLRWAVTHKCTLQSTLHNINLWQYGERESVGDSRPNLCWLARFAQEFPLVLSLNKVVIRCLTIMLITFLCGIRGLNSAQMECPQRIKNNPDFSDFFIVSWII